ncbi:hypothetical protein P4V86_15430 [Brevibacillus laterosporus]|uniref:hypothetical protein n=1 Tax=Brevibacillus laterosporus TaxID=1465 RepID=UPI0003672E4F|nr:hypothetical protein [Brevibacillus laterosporus]ATO51003.1 hypothetical protein BrL25_19020 [Brevibacillus laterosporus DSM 25]MED2004737.1 hypothetical protein [Brevibacillus laterosporus]
MPIVPHEMIDNYDELEREVDSLKTVMVVVSGDLRRLASELHTEDSDVVYDNLLDYARHLENAAGLRR